MNKTIVDSRIFIFCCSAVFAACGGGEDLGSSRVSSPLESNANNQTTNTSNNNANSKFTSMALGSQITNCTSTSFSQNFTNTATMHNTGLASCSLDLNNSYGCSFAGLRSWIGHSTAVGGSLTEGFTREQAFVFSNLVPNQRYSLKIFIIGSRGIFKARAYISDGEIVSGSTRDFNSSPNTWGCSPVGEYWDVQFVSKGSSAVLKLTNDQVAGVLYFYPSHYILSKI